MGAIAALGMAVQLDPDQGDYVAHLGYALYRSKPGSDVIRRYWPRRTSSAFKS